MELLNYIVWNPSLSIGPFRWYSLCWLIGLALAYLVVKHLYKEQKIKDELFDPLFFYCFLGILIGARLGHCIFYQPDYFLTSGKGFVEMLLPIHFLQDGGWKFTGYEGLASHGGTLGLMIALWLYVKKTKLSIWQVLDNIAIATGITACFIRLGNLMNSEIIGKVTDVPWAFIFERVDGYPRHPGQLYEAMAYAVLFALMWWLHKQKANKIGTGWFFGLCLTYIFTFRFFIEYTKEIQEAFEASLPLDMGQILSIPFVVIGICCMAGGKWMKHLTMIALLTVFSTNVNAQNTTEEQQLRQQYYDLFTQPDKQDEFYKVSKQLKEMMLSKEDRHAYYTFGINDITYEINMHHTTEALQKANAMLKEMTENHDGHFDMIYNVIGTIYQDRGNYKMAKMYMQKAISHVQPTDSAGMVGAYIGMANLESSVNPDKAIALADTILPYCRKYPTHYAYALIAKAQSYFFKNDSRMFFDIYEQYVVYKRENRLQDTQSDDIMATLKSAFDGNYQEALDHINNDSLYTENIGRYDLRIQLFEMMGNKDMVIAEQQKKLNAIDSLNSNFIYENLNRMNAEMDVAKTQQKAERARVYWLIAVVLLLVVIIGLMFWRYLTRRHFQKELMLRNQELEVALLRAEEADRMQTSFIKHVSHEIRTPLNVITGFAQIITNPQYEFDEAERNRMLQDISRNTMEITNIVNELLEIAQDESRQHYDKIDVVNINNACKKIIADMQPYNTRNLNIDFITDLTDDFTIHTNKQALQRIITQLMDNALKFTEKGNIELYVHDTPDHGTIRFIITDTGIGIEEKNQNHVFDKFFKADSFKQGFGLGLTISRKMAVLLGGSLNLDKTYTDGARFILSLPTS